MFFQFLKFSIVGVINTFIDFTLFNVLLFAIPHQSDALVSLFSALSYGAGSLNSLFFNKKWAFKNYTGHFFSTLIKFYTIVLSALALNFLIVYCLLTVLDGDKIQVNIVKVIANVIILLYIFTGFKYWAFK